MNYEHGFGEIEVNGKVYELRPTLSNIEKIGTPKEIVNILQRFHYKQVLYVDLFRQSAHILQCCGIPEHITGSVQFSTHSLKSMIVPGKIPVSEVFILAEHCLMHGVCGIIDEDDKDSDKTGKPLTEFNASDYIVDAIEILGLSLSEAENITMTQFIKLAKSKMKLHQQRTGKDEPSDSQKKLDEDEAFAFYNSVVDKVNEVGLSQVKENKSKIGGKTDKKSQLTSISAKDTFYKIKAREAGIKPGE